MTHRMNPSLRILISKVLVLSIGWLSIAELAAEEKLRQHPFLLFTAQELQELRAKSKDYIPEPFVASLKRKAKRNRDDPGFLAFSGLWFQDSAIRGRAKEILLKKTPDSGLKTYTVHTGSHIRTVVYAYDWLHDLLSEKQRDQVLRHIASSVRIGMSQWGNRTHRGGNWEASIFSSFVVAGVLLKDSEADAQKWIDTGIKGITEGYLTNFLGPDGAAEEPYLRYTLNVAFYSMLPAMDAYRRATGKDVFKEVAPLFGKQVEFFACMLFPDRKGLCNFGNSRTGLYPVFPFLLKMSAEYKDGLASWYLNQLMKDGLTPNNWGMVAYFLWGHAAAQTKPIDPDTSPRLPRSRAYAEVQDGYPKSPGQIFMRTGYSRTDDVLLAVPGNIASHHGHADKGSYILHAFGELLIEDPYQESTKSYRDASSAFFRSDACHNSVLIDGAGQSFIRGGGLHDRHYGQLIARVEQFRQDRHFDYARIDLKRTYQIHPKNRSVKKATRHIVFLRDARPQVSIVIIDDFHKDGGKYTFSHHFQPADQLEVDLQDNSRILLKSKRAKCLVAIMHPERIHLEEAEQFKSKYIRAVCKDPTDRLSLITVLYPSRANTKDDAPVSKKTEGVEILVSVGQQKVGFNTRTGTVTVDGSPLTLFPTR